MHVGVTGHQRLDDPSAWSWAEAEISRKLDELTGPLVAVTSLAIGADQLLARIVLQRGGRVHAVLPFAGYERMLARPDVPAYRDLLAQSQVEVLNVLGEVENAYLAAGCRVVDLSELLIAVWDGEPAKGKGGTGDVVAYARGKRVPLVHINPVSRSVSVRVN